MSLVKKLKDILFEVEEDETQPIKVREDAKKEIKFNNVANDPVEIKPNPAKTFEDTLEIKEVKNETKVEIKKENPVNNSERQLFTQDNSFKFPDFDEEEFKSSMSRSKQNANVLDIERKKSSEKRNEYRGYERPEPSKEIEKKKFKPSPIISPVYGILNQDYVADDIVDKNEVLNNLDIDKVRKKAFEPKPEVPETLDIIETPSINDIVNETIDVEIKDNNKHDKEAIGDPVVTFFEEKDNIKVEEKNEDEYAKVDELLESASVEIPLEDTLEIPKTNNLDAIEEELEKIDEETKEKDKDLDDTLDSDLFELIDSMYEDREEG